MTVSPGNLGTGLYGQYWGTTKRVQRRQKWTTAWAAWNGLVFGRFEANFTFQTLDGVSFLFEKGAYFLRFLAPQK